MSWLNVSKDGVFRVCSPVSAAGIGDWTTKNYGRPSGREIHNNMLFRRCFSAKTVRAGKRLTVRSMLGICNKARPSSSFSKGVAQDLTALTACSKQLYAETCTLTPQYRTCCTDRFLSAEIFGGVPLLPQRKKGLGRWAALVFSG